MAEAWDNASRLHAEQEENIKVVAACEKILNYRPSHPKARQRLGRAQIQADFRRALNSTLGNITKH